MMTDSDDLQRGAERLLEAAATGMPCAPIRDIIDADDTDSAYRIAQIVTGSRLDDGDTIVGHKIGLTSPAVQQQFGVSQPDFGVLLASMAESEDGSIALESLLQPRIEAEIAFVLRSDLDSPEITDEEALESVDFAVAALEIVDSRIRDWDITIADTVADNASSGRYVLGRQRIDPRSVEIPSVRMELHRDGASVSSGNGAACLGSPVTALTWLARTLAHLGEPLTAGQTVLSGALGPVAEVSPGATFTAAIEHLGTVTARFGAVR